MGNGRLKSAGTSEIARASGGDSMAVDDAAALETTMERIRQSYALFFNAPENIRQGEQRNVEISLIGGVARRFPDAELRYRQTYIVSEGSTTSGPAVSSSDVPTVTRRNPSSNGSVFDEPAPTKSSTDEPPKMKRRPMVDEPGGSRKVDIVTASTSGSAEKAAEKAEVKTVEADKAADPPPATGGFRRLKPGEKP